MNVLFICFIVGVCFFCLVNFLCFHFYGFGISNKLMAIIAQTNYDETAEFLPTFLANLYSEIHNPATWLFIVIFICLIMFANKLAPIGIIRSVIYVVSVVGAAFMVFFVAILPAGKTDLFVPLRVTKTIVRTVRENRHLTEIMNQVKYFPELEQTVSSGAVTNLCMIIGESASRQNLEVYGYPLPTSPNAMAMRDSLFIFEDALASSTSTALNMERILSFMPDSDFSGNWYDYPMLIDLMNAAGYRTYWLSNQEKSGIWSNSSAAMVAHADEIKYVGNLSSEDHLLQRFDEVLLPYVTEAFNNSAPSKFIGVHLKGSHTRYYNRYPEEFNRFSATDVLRTIRHPWLDETKAQRVAEYDNSILYTDFVVNEIIDKARRSDKPSLVLYFSDHGENVYFNRDFCGRDSLFVEVPFYIYANNAFHKAFPDKIKKLEDARNRHFSTANIIHTIMSLTSTMNPYYDKKLDILSDSFVTRPRKVDGRVWGKDKGTKTVLPK